MCRDRYQPDYLHEKPRINGETDALTLEERECETAGSESCLSALKSDGLNLRCIFSSSILPTEQTSTVVNAAVAVIGQRHHRALVRQRKR